MGRAAWIWSLTMTLACAGLALALVAQQRARAVDQVRIRALEDQLEAYRSLAEDQARWAEEWKLEKRELIRRQRSAAPRPEQ